MPEQLQLDQLDLMDFSNKLHIENIFLMALENYELQFGKLELNFNISSIVTFYAQNLYQFCLAVVASKIQKQLKELWKFSAPESKLVTILLARKMMLIGKNVSQKVKIEQIFLNQLSSFGIKEVTWAVLQI